MQTLGSAQMIANVLVAVQTTIPNGMVALEDYLNHGVVCFGPLLELIKSYDAFRKCAAREHWSIKLELKLIRDI